MSECAASQRAFGMLRVASGIVRASLRAWVGGCRVDARPYATQIQVEVKPTTFSDEPDRQKGAAGANAHGDCHARLTL